MRHTWSPAPGLVAVGWAGAVVAGLLAALATDAPSRLLGAVAALMLAAAALFGTVARPRLTVDESGIAVRGLFGTRHWPWSNAHRVHVVRHRRLGREVPMLELDTVDASGTEHLTVLGRLDLDAHPEDVLTTINTIRGL